MNSEINNKNKSLTLVDGSGFILELIMHYLHLQEKMALQ